MGHSKGVDHMFNNRRSELEIIEEILSLSQDGVRKTEILYQVNLSHLQLKKYLSVLQQKEMLMTKAYRSNGSNGFLEYQTTPKGMKFLSDINKTLSHLR